MGSGNIVHNLRRIDWQHPEGAYEWAQETNTLLKEAVYSDQLDSLLNNSSWSTAFKLSVPTLEHYLPLIYTLGLKGNNDVATTFNDAIVMGSISMTSFMFK